MTTRDPRRRQSALEGEPDPQAGETPSTDIFDPRNAARGIPIARPDPSKPYPEEDEETRRVHHAADVASGDVGDVSHTGPVVVVPVSEHKE